MAVEVEGSSLTEHVGTVITGPFPWPGPHGWMRHGNELKEKVKDDS